MNTIKIGGITYQIMYQEKLVDEGKLVWGHTDYTNATICIDSTLSKSKQRQTLFHEMAHAMLHEAGLDEDSAREGLVNPLGNMLYQVYEDNKKAADAGTSTADKEL